MQAIGAIKVLEQKIGAREGLVKRIKAQRVPAGSFLKELSMIMPGDVAVRDISFDQGSNKVLLKIVVSAQHEDPDNALVHLIERLEESAFFAQVTLLASRTAGEFFEGEVSCDLIQ